MSSLSLVFSDFSVVLPNPYQFAVFTHAILLLLLTAIFTQFETLFVPSLTSFRVTSFLTFTFPDCCSNDEERCMLLCSLEVVVLG